MDRLDMKKEAAPTASHAPLMTIGNTATYPLPPEYSKPIRFRVNGKIIRVKGGRALVLDRLIAAGPKGIDRATTLQWIANLSDTVKSLKDDWGIGIETRLRQPCNYALLSHVERIGGAA